MTNDQLKAIDGYLDEYMQIICDEYPLVYAEIMGLRDCINEELCTEVGEQFGDYELFGSLQPTRE